MTKLIGRMIVVAGLIGACVPSFAQGSSTTTPRLDPVPFYKPAYTYNNLGRVNGFASDSYNIPRYQPPAYSSYGNGAGSSYTPKYTPSYTPSQYRSPVDSSPLYFRGSSSSFNNFSPLYDRNGVQTPFFAWHR